MEINEIKGLTTSECQEKIRQGKINKTQSKTSKTYQSIVLSNLFNVFNLVVFAIAGVLIALYFTLNAKKTLYDGLSISTVALVNSIISMIQEVRAKVALDKIIALSKAMSTVIRDGKEQEIAMEEIVEGDVIVLKTGDQVPVDGKILHSKHCEVDESLLTGESEYIYKQVDSPVLSGSFCVAGRGVLVAEKVGKESYIHRVATEIRTFKRFVSPLQQKIDLLVQILVSLATLMVLLVVGKALVSHVLMGQKVDVIETTRSVAAIVTSMIPIGLILLSTVAFALGVFRISKQGALIQKLNAVESFAHVNTICMDKTGTLTKNELVYSEVFPSSSFAPDQMKEMLGHMAHSVTDVNATMLALQKKLTSSGVEVLEEVPFNSKEKYSAVTYQQEGKKHHVVLGAFETLKSRLSSDDVAFYEGILEHQLGARTLLFSSVEDVKGSLRETLQQKEHPLRLIGLVRLDDEIRAEIQQTIMDFHERGIRLKVISGDAPSTVQTVAKQAGWLEDTSKVITGAEIDAMSESEIAQTASQYSLFARVSPQNKKSLIQGLQSQKNYVAMVGDGVNDVLALKQAQMGIAMGAGNRMSKDVSDIVLLNNDFTILPKVFEEGDSIIGNVQSSAKLFLTKNMYSVLLILFTGFLGLSFPFVPRHVTIIGFFSISVPALLITFSKRMKEVPKHFLKDVLRFVLIAGACISLSALVAFFLSMVVFKRSIEEARVALLTQVVLLSLINFLLIVGHKKPKTLLNQNKGMTLFAFGFAFVYFLLLLVVTQIPVLKGLADFLEIKPMLWKEIAVGMGLVACFGSMMSWFQWKVLQGDE